MTDTATVRQVIRFLGWLALILCFGAILLAFRIIDGGKITPEQVSVLTPIVGLAGTSLGAIGALLVSTHSVDPAPTPEQAQPEEGEL